MDSTPNHSFPSGRQGSSKPRQNNGNGSKNYRSGMRRNNQSHGYNNSSRISNSSNSGFSGGAYNPNSTSYVGREENGTTYYYNAKMPSQLYGNDNYDEFEYTNGHDVYGCNTGISSVAHPERTTTETPPLPVESETEHNQDYGYWNPPLSEPQPWCNFIFGSNQNQSRTYRDQSSRDGGVHCQGHGSSSSSNYEYCRNYSPENTMNSFESKMKGEIDREKIGASRAKPKLVFKAPADPPREFENQRDALIDQLSNNMYECMVCCAKLTRRQPIWSCGNCFNVFHHTCIKKWVNSSAIEKSWRCPGCQNVVDAFPENYVCFCGKTRNPSVATDVPHCCSLVCGKVKSGGTDCTHLCSLTCHPGPCPPCNDLVKRSCQCAKKTAFVQCSSKTAVLCGSICEKLLNCGIHSCTKNCHVGPCENCIEKLVLNCHCKKNKKEVLCSIDCNIKSIPSYCCGIVCGTLLNCQNHECPDLCHPDQCTPCPSSTDVVISCPCSQTPIVEACFMQKLPPRKSCLDPIPTCTKICKKILTCGPLRENHQCQKNCHVEVPCPPCKLSTTVKCRCGNQELDIPCNKLLSSGDFSCGRLCLKKRNCGRHKCNTRCCIDPDHMCPIICDKPLRCGNHRCESLCHIGHCSICRNVSFEELRCECGTAVIYPPVPCGTKPPPCIKPCGREHICSHPVVHNCHSDTTCPACSYLTEKWCYGKHELRKNILCHVTQLSCGMACQKLLSCSRHKCPRICHPEACQKPGDVCKLPCLERRNICGHPCASSCHDGFCPGTKCIQMTEATCQCGRRKESLLCWKIEVEFDRIVATAVASGINDLFLDYDKDGGKRSEKPEVTVENLTASIRKEKSRINVLDCDKECLRIERNRKMAQALQLENPDVETRLGTPKYTDFCKQFAKKYPQFVEMVHSKLTEVVMQVKRSKKLNQTYEFDSMNRDKRQLIHEYSDHFGVQSESFEEEPNRNVMVTASKNKSWLPSVSLIDAVFKQTALKTDRKNVHQDLELVEPTKGLIIGPSNRRLVSKTATKMVCLNGS